MFFQMCELAKLFSSLVEADNRFTIVAPVKLGLVCFKLKVRDFKPQYTKWCWVEFVLRRLLCNWFCSFQSTNEANSRLLAKINDDRRIHLVAGVLGDELILRFSVNSPLATPDDISYAWSVITSLAPKTTEDFCHNVLWIVLRWFDSKITR